MGPGRAGDMTSDQPQWTTADLLLMWEVGRAYERYQIQQAAEDLWSAPSLRPAQPTAEQRIAARLADMEAAAREMAARLAALRGRGGSTARR